MTSPDPFHLRKQAMSREEHDEIMKHRNRPITQDVVDRREADPERNEPENLVDGYVAHYLRNGGDR